MDLYPDITPEIMKKIINLGKFVVVSSKRHNINFVLFIQKR